MLELIDNLTQTRADLRLSTNMLKKWITKFPRRTGFTFPELCEFTVHTLGKENREEISDVINELIRALLYLEPYFDIERIGDFTVYCLKKPSNPTNTNKSE